MASLSDEEKNYVRMCLLLTGISPRAVRTYFDGKFSPACLDSTIKKMYTTLYDMRKKHIINQSQWNRLLPRFPDVPDSKNFDVTLMTTLLRNLTPLTPPLCGFDSLPYAMETTPGSDIARIKYYRSFLAHLDDCKLDTIYMTTAWADITGAIGRLGGQQMKQECDHLKIKPLDQTNQEIKQSYDEINELKESFKRLTRSHTDILKSYELLQEHHTEVKKSHDLLQEEHARMTKEMEIMKTSQEDTVPWNIRDERIPTEIRNMEQRYVDIYLSALQFGSEKKKNINLKIVGKKGAGKTSLVCRLFGEELTKVDSTNGIDIHRRKFKIKSDPWTKMEERDKESDFRIRLKKSFVEKLSTNSKDQSTPGILPKQNPNIAETLHKDKILYERIEGNDNFNERVEDKDDVITGKIKQRKDIDVPVHVLEQGSNQPTNDVPQNSKEIVTEFLAISNEVLKDDEDYTTLTLWDFAGDEEFYATHQTFLNPDAVYLVVVNLNDKDQENKHETFKFWMDTIHCYGFRTDTIEVNPIKQITLFDPPVIFVGTHTDELENEDSYEIISSYIEDLCEDSMQHLRQSYPVSNTKYGNGQFLDIREYIFDLATNSKNYERQYPVKLIRLERVLHDEYKSGRRILSYSEVRDLASKISDFPITDKEELNLFLRYQHEIGYLVFFHDIPEYIILDPQWLIDAFKCIVTVTKFQNKLLVPYFKMWQEVKKTGKISYQLIKAIFLTQQNNFMDHQDHLLAVMKKFDIIINPLVQTIKSHVNSNEETYFYIPWMMKVKKTKVDNLFRVKNEFKSTCLCFNFNFLPPYLISHLIVSCIRKYSVASVHKQEGLFKDCCVFDISENGCTKLLLIKYDNLIQLQIWQWDKDQPCQYKEIFNFIKGELQRIVNIRYRMTTVSFNEKWKCSLTSYSYNCESSLKDFGEIRDGENFYCGEHGEYHQYKDDWFGETSKKYGDKLPAGLEESDEEAGPDKKRHKAVNREVQQTLVDRFRGVDASSTTKFKVTFQAGTCGVSNISAESSRAGSSSGFSKEEINFAQMGMIVLNVLVSVLYDLLKKDATQYMRPRSESDVTYLYDLLRKSNKHVPSNSSNRKFGPWGGKWKDIQKTDQAIGDDIERIRLTRNEILHSSEFILEDKRYKELCGIIADILVRFDQHNQPSPELYTDKMSKILAKTISDEEVKDVKHQIQNKYRAEMEIEIELEHHMQVQPH